MDLPNNDVQPGSSPVQSELPKTPVVVEPVPGTEPAQPPATEPTKPPVGFVPYQALEEERKLRREAEQRAADLESRPAHTGDDPGGVPLDEDDPLRKEVSTLRDEVSSLREERELERIVAKHPVLNDKAAEFEEFRKDYPRHKLENVAKIFLAEHGLLEAEPARKGLEVPTGGSRVPTPSGLTPEQVKEIRNTDFRRYEQLLREGKIRPDEIK